MRTLIRSMVFGLLLAAVCFGPAPSSLGAAKLPLLEQKDRQALLEDNNILRGEEINAPQLIYLGYMRLIKDVKEEADKLVATEGDAQIFIPFKEYCKKQLLANPDARTLYQLDYDAQAKRDLDVLLAEVPIDPNKLLLWSSHYFASSYSAKGLMLAGDLFLERGSLDRAEDCYRRAAQYIGDKIDGVELEVARVYTRIGYVLAQRGQRLMLDKLIKQIADDEELKGEVVLSESGEVLLVDYLRALQVRTPEFFSDPSDTFLWTNLGGSPDRSKVMVSDALLGECQWVKPFVGAQLTDSGAGKDQERLVVIPAVKNNLVAFVGPSNPPFGSDRGDYLHVLDLQTGALQYSRVLVSSPINQGEITAGPAIRNCTIVGDALITVTSRFTDGGNNEPAWGNRILAFDLTKPAGETLAPMWSIGGMPDAKENASAVQINREVRSVLFDLAPVSDGKTLFISGLDSARFEVFLFAFDLQTQQLKWKVNLGRIDAPQSSLYSFMDCAKNSVTLGDGVCYLLSDQELLAAVNSYTGELLWIRKLEGRPAGKSSNRGMSSLIYTNGLLIGSYSTGGFIAAWNALSGQEVWKQRSSEIGYCVGVSDDNVYLTRDVRDDVRPSFLQALDLYSGLERWRWNFPEAVAGRPALTAHCVYVPTEKGVYRIQNLPPQVRLDEKGEEIVERHPDGALYQEGFKPWEALIAGGARSQFEPGDLYIFGKVVLVCSQRSVAAFENRTDLEGEFTHWLQQNPQDPTPLILRSQVLFFKQDFPAAAADLRAALRLLRQSMSGHDSEAERKVQTLLFEAYAKQARQAVPGKAIVLWRELLPMLTDKRLIVRVGFAAHALYDKLGDDVKKIEMLHDLVDKADQVVLGQDSFSDAPGLSGAALAGSRVSVAKFIHDLLLELWKKLPAAEQERLEQASEQEFARAVQEHDTNALQGFIFKFPFTKRKAEVMYNLGLLSMDAGECSRAVRFFEALVNDYPASPLVLSALKHTIGCFGELDDIAAGRRAVRAYYDRLTARVGRAWLGAQSFVPAASSGGGELRGKRFKDSGQVLALVESQLRDFSVQALENRSSDPDDRDRFVVRRDQWVECWDVKRAERLWAHRSKYDFMGMKLNVDDDDNLFVEAISEYSPFYRVGVRQNDILMYVDDAGPMRSASGFVEHYRSLDIGSTVSLEIGRGAVALRFSMSCTGDMTSELRTPEHFDEDRLLVLEMEELCALDLDKGRKLWSAPMRYPLVNCSIDTHGGVAVVVGTTVNNPYRSLAMAFDVYTGEELWVHPLEFRPVVKPIQFAGQHVLFSGYDALGSQLAIVDLFGGRMKLAHRYESPSYASGRGFLLSADRLIMMNDPSTIRAVDLATLQTAWQLKLPDDFADFLPYDLAVTSAGRELVVFFPNQFTMWAVDADTGEVAWRHNQLNACDDFGGVMVGGLNTRWDFAARSRMFFDGSHLFVTYSRPQEAGFESNTVVVENWIACFELASGRFLWSHVPLFNDNIDLQFGAWGESGFIVQALYPDPNAADGKKARLCVYGGAKHGVKEGRLLQSFNDFNAEDADGKLFCQIGNALLIERRGKYSIFLAE